MRPRSLALACLVALSPAPALALPLGQALHKVPPPARNDAIPAGLQNVEIEEKLGAKLPLLRQGHVDAGIRRIDPAAQDKHRPRLSRGIRRVRIIGLDAYVIALGRRDDFLFASDGQTDQIEDRIARHQRCLLDQSRNW